MDTPHHPKASETPEPPPAIVQPGTAAERPQGTVSAEWNMDVDTMLNRPGFAAFLENYNDAESLEVTEENKEEIGARFRAFEASKTVARQFETAMNQKLQTEGKGRMNTQERQAYKDYVAEIATKNPDELMDLQNDLRALEEHPEKIRQKEAELVRLREDWKAEKVKAGIAELATKKAAVEKSLVEADAKEFSRLQRFFFNNVGARSGTGKIARHIDQTRELTAELQEVDSTIQAAEEALISSPEIIADTRRALQDATHRLESARESIFASNKAAQMVRERLISEAHKRCDNSLESIDIGVLQKAAEQFTADEKLAETGTDYLDLGADPGFAEDYKRKLSEQMEKAISVGILRALETLPSGATQSRLERALRTFTKLTEQELGFADKDTGKEFVLEVLAKAEKNARLKHKGSGKSIMLKHLISKLSKTGGATA